VTAEGEVPLAGWSSYLESPDAARPLAKPPAGHMKVSQKGAQFDPRL